MSKSYSIKSIHLEKLQAIKRDILDRQANRNRREAKHRAEEHAALLEWRVWKDNCKPIKGNQTKLF